MRWMRRGLALVLTLWLLGAWGVTLPAQAPESLSDNLKGRTLEPIRWVIGKLHAQGRVVPTERGLRLTLNLRNVAKFFAHTVWLRCRIVGSFDARVSYELEDWPFASGIRLGLGVHPDPQPLGSTTLHGVFGEPRGMRTVVSERVSLARDVETTYPNGGEFYIAETNGREGRLFPTRDREGQLRLSRAGNTFTAWYWDRGGRLWIPSGQWSVNPEIRDDEWVALQLWGRETSPRITVLFKDFSLEAERLVCP